MSLKPQRPTAKRGSTISPPAGANSLRTQCSACGLAVFTWQQTRWSRDPMGIVHDNCEEAS